MTAKRALLAALLAAILLLSSLPAVQARPCAEALSRCAGACTEQFGGGIFGSLMAGGCYAGCNIGYVWCASSN
jgi:hypothetical protein